jgi:hypothetical protein
MTQSLSSRIQDVINLRAQQLPRIQGKIRKAEEIRDGLNALDRALTKLEGHPHVIEQLKEHIHEFKKLPLQASITTSLQELEIAQNRLLRKTINIGVSGQARVGKSTLLQTISGLTDDQIPTGDGIPVTAVRSQLRHSTTHQRATLAMHTFDTFREQILVPYHKAIQLVSTPYTLEEFRRFDYANPSRTSDALPELTTSQNGLLSRLRAMQASLPSYEKELQGGTKTVSLEGLRSWVAYPTLTEEENNSACSRLYLAVQNALIECGFPENEVADLNIIDLPGLGELDAKAEERHVDGLKNEVDLVLLIKRPSPLAAFWKEEDAKAADLLDKARGAISRRGDFVFIVSNDDNSNPSLSKALLTNIRSNVNEGIDGKHYQVITCNAKDADNVRQNLLSPCLEHLASRLQHMDGEVIDAACQALATAINNIQAELSDLQGAVRQYAPPVAGLDHRLNHKVDDLHMDIAAGLYEIVDDLYGKARAKKEDSELVNIIRKIADEVEEWIDDGLGEGKDQWIEKSFKRMQRDNNVAGLAVDEINYARVNISEQYAKVDLHFNEQVDQLWAEISNVLVKETGRLLEDQSGKAALETFYHCLDSAEEPCEVLKQAVQDLLSLKIGYRSHFHPLVREKIDFLNYEVKDPRNGAILSTVNAEVSKQGTEVALNQISNLANKASFEIQQSLIKEANLAMKVFHAAAEQFLDSLIRSKESKWEFGRLGRSYRDEIWPEEFQSIDTNNAKIAGVSRAIQNLQKLIAQA